MNRKALALVACLSTVAGSLAVPAPAHAFRMIQQGFVGRQTDGAAVACNDPLGFTRWETPNTTWLHNASGQGAGKAAALQNAMAAWTNVPDASHVLTYGGATNAGWATDNVNTILWAVGNGCVGNCLALTALVLRQPGQVIIESDITFDADDVWNTDGSDNDTEAVAAHELGHALGIHHTELGTLPKPTMNCLYFGSGGRSLENDDRAALRCSQNASSPPAPASLTVVSQQCFGFNDVSWPASPGAVSYRLYSSSTASFASQTLLYSGSQRQRTINVQANRHLRVQACDNNFGCGAYRNGNAIAQYVNSCN